MPVLEEDLTKMCWYLFIINRCGGSAPGLASASSTIDDINYEPSLWISSVIIMHPLFLERYWTLCRQMGNRDLLREKFIFLICWSVLVLVCFNKIQIQHGRSVVWHMGSCLNFFLIINLHKGYSSLNTRCRPENLPK